MDQQEIILSNIRQAASSQLDWHFHYLPPNCNLADGDNHRIVLEFAGGKLQIHSFPERPIQLLEQIENIFYGRTT